MGYSYIFASVGMLISSWLIAESVQGQRFYTPPAPYAVAVEQPDGTTLQLIARGNEVHHWSETLDGYTVVQNEVGQYVYAQQQNNALVASSLIAQDPTERTLLEQRRLLAIPRNLKLTHNQHVASQRIIPLGNARVSQATLSSMPTQGKLKVLAICIDYPDLPATYEAESFLSTFNGPSDKPSFKKYFLDNSYGALDITVDVVGWVRAENNHAYYGETNGKERARALVAEAVASANEAGVNFSEYDNNDDGNVDGLIIIHAGPGAEEGNEQKYIWSHRWSGVNEYHDGQQVSDYIIAPEVRRKSGQYKKVGIGIFCHEFGHLLGLPDLYDTDPNDNQSEGIGEWGLMGFGGFVGEEHYPAGMTAWSKEVMGWADVVDITDQYGEYQLQAASTNNAFYKIRTGKSQEYFLLENRQTTGVDSQLKGTGLAVWHINQEITYPYFYSVRVNADVNRKGVDLEEADGYDDLDNRRNRGDKGDLYPGSSNRQTFNYQSSPSSDAYGSSNNSKQTGVSLEHIQEDNRVVQFAYRRDLPHMGQACNQPAIALLGENEIKPSAHWYVFTMPKAGSLSISGQSSDKKVSIYQSCDNQIAATAEQHNVRSVDRFTEGQKVLIYWEVDAEDTFAWTLSVEDVSKVKPVITAAAVPTKTYGDDDFLLDARANDNLPINLAVEKGNITLDGNKVSIQGAGEVRIRATRPEDERFLAADPYYITFNVEKARQAVTLKSIDDFTYQPEKTIPLQFATITSLPVTLTVVKGGISIQGAVATIKQAGAVSIRASQPGNENYHAATATWDFEILKAPQRINLTAITDKMVTDSPFALEATSDADLPVSFRIIEGKASVQGDMLSVTGSGEVVVEAYNEGNVNYQPSSTQRTFLVLEPAKENQVIAVNSLPDTVTVGEKVVIKVSVNSGLNPTIQVLGGATRSDSIITFVQTGEVTIRVNQPGDDRYNAATFTKKIVVTDQPVVKPLAQALTFEKIDNQPFTTQPIPLKATTTSGLPIAYQVIAGSAVIEGDSLMLTGLGMITVEASQTGGNGYAPATTRTTFEVTRANQVIEFEIIELVNNAYKLQASASSGLPVFFEIQEGQATISNDTLLAIDEGLVTVVATQPGNPNFFAAEPQAKTLKAQTVTSVENEPAENAVSIYPNPSPQVFQVILPMVATPAYYRVINTQGVVVQQGIFLQIANEIDLERLAVGAYVLHLHTGDDHQYHRLLKE